MMSNIKRITEMNNSDTREDCNDEEKVVYYNSNGLVAYYITNLVKRTTINIPFDYFDHYIEVILKIQNVKLDGFYANKIVNAEKNKGAAIRFFEDLKNIGDKYFVQLYKAVWEKVPVSQYKYLLPNIIDDFHGDIVESIKRFSKSLESAE